MNKRLKHSVAVFMIASLLVSVAGLAVNWHTCFSSGSAMVSLVASANQGEDPDCPHLKEAHKVHADENLPPCCAAAAQKARAAADASAKGTKSDSRSCSGSNLSAPSDCCKNFTKVLSIDSTSVIQKHDLKFAGQAYVATFINNYGLRDKIDKLKVYSRSVREAVSAPIVGLIRILRIINPSRQDSPEAN